MIWSQFESNLRSAAYTNSMSRFYDSICRKLGIVLEKGNLSKVVALVGDGSDRTWLKLIRDETATLVALVRLMNEKEKKEIARNAKS